jgi:hypothetical protein
MESLSALLSVTSPSLSLGAHAWEHIDENTCASVT